MKFCELIAFSDSGIIVFFTEIDRMEWKIIETEYLVKHPPFFHSPPR